MPKGEWKAHFTTGEEGMEIIPMEFTYTPEVGESVRTSRGPHRIAGIDEYHQHLDIEPDKVIQTLTT